MNRRQQFSCSRCILYKSYACRPLIMLSVVGRRCVTDAFRPRPMSPTPCTHATTNVTYPMRTLHVRCVLAFPMSSGINRLSHAITDVSLPMHTHHGWCFHALVVADSTGRCHSPYEHMLCLMCVWHDQCPLSKTHTPHLMNAYLCWFRHTLADIICQCKKKQYTMHAYHDRCHMPLEYAFMTKQMSPNQCTHTMFEVCMRLTISLDSGRCKEATIIISQSMPTRHY